MANNLLDKSSIILTPTAYDNGTVLCVKPSDGSGDFDFSRNSAATRVNAQGLVENVQILSSNLVQNGDFSEEGVQEVSNGSFSQEGSELVTNGDFSNGSTGWNLGGTAEVLNGVGNFFSDGDYFRQLGILSANVNYKITFDINVISGTIYAAYDGTTAPTIISEVGSTTQKVYYNTSSGGDLWFYGINFRGSIDNVSVREVGQDWNLIGTATITENQANIVTASAVTGISQSNILTIGKSYKLSYNIVSNNNGGLKISGNEIPSVVGNNTYYFEASAASLEILRNSGITDISITNISVKEVGQNWDLDANWSIAEDKAVSDGSVNGFIRTSTNVFESGKTYKVGITVSNMTTGLVSYPYDGSGVTYINSNGNFSQIYTPDDTNICWIYGRNGFDGSITNISVIEITDDTNLPRINYEGFSYQDVLGSELVTNGDFATDSDWIKQSSWTISNGTANYDGISSGNYLRQSWSPLTIGKTYRMTFDISDGSAYLQIRSGTSLLFEGLNIVLYGTGSHVIEAKAISNLDNLRIYAYTSGGGTSFSIDNVSVKEITGQEVVPDSGCGSWLFEPQSTNLLPYSEDFSQYSTGNIPIVSGGFLAPDGTNNAYKITDSGSSTVYIASIPNLSITDTRSIYARSVSGTGTATLMSYFGNTNNVFTLTEDWQRFEVNGTDAVAGEDNFYAADFRGSGTLNEYIIWGAQVEALSYATSYIPTEGLSVTRNQDLCTNGATGTGLINSTEGVLYAEIAALAKINPSGNITLTDGTGNNRIYIYYLIDNSISVIYNVNSTGASINNFSLANITDQTKIAVRWGNSNVSVWINGASVLSNTTSNFLPNTLNVLSFAKPAGGVPFEGKTKALAVWKEALSDAELLKLTTI